MCSFGRRNKKRHREGGGRPRNQMPLCSAEKQDISPLGWVNYLAKIRKTSVSETSNSLTSVLMQIFREKSLSGRAAARGHRSFRGRRGGGGRGQVQRRRGGGGGLGGPRRSARPRRLRRLHHRHGPGRRRSRRGRRRPRPRAREVERLHLAVRNVHLGVVSRMSLHSRREMLDRSLMHGLLARSVASLSRRCKEDHQ